MQSLKYWSALSCAPLVLPLSLRGDNCVLQAGFIGIRGYLQYNDDRWLAQVNECLMSLKGGRIRDTRFFSLGMVARA